MHIYVSTYIYIFYIFTHYDKKKMSSVIHVQKCIFTYILC